MGSGPTHTRNMELSPPYLLRKPVKYETISVPYEPERTLLNHPIPIDPVTFGLDPQLGDAPEERDLRRRTGHFFASLNKLDGRDLTDSIVNTSIGLPCVVSPAP